jgi:Flp pilus assembly protein CpaB
VSPRRYRGGLFLMGRWLVVGVLIVVAVGLGAAAFLVGDPFSSLLARWRDDGELRVPRGMVTVFLSGVNIPAYTRIARNHIWDAKRDRPAVTFMEPGQVKDIIIDPAQLLGRVLARDKPAGYVFTADDFLPPGTRPGLVAGIPAGMRALRLEADRIHGMHGLAAGDRFDLVATVPIDAKAMTGLPLSGAYKSQIEIQARMSNWQKQAAVRVIVQNGMIVAPVSTRAAPTTSQSLTRGTTTTTRPVQELVIAVAPEEVATLTEALALKTDISAVPRSGRPDDPADSLTPDLHPWNPFGTADGVPGSYTIVETIAGAKRDFAAVPRR